MYSNFLATVSVKAMNHTPYIYLKGNWDDVRVIIKEDGNLYAETVTQCGSYPIGYLDYYIPMDEMVYNVERDITKFLLKRHVKPILDSNIIRQFCNSALSFLGR